MVGDLNDIDERIYEVESVNDEGNLNTEFIIPSRDLTYNLTLNDFIDYSDSELNEYFLMDSQYFNEDLYPPQNTFYEPERLPFHGFDFFHGMSFDSEEKEIRNLLSNPNFDIFRETLKNLQGSRNDSRTNTLDDFNYNHYIKEFTLFNHQERSDRLKDALIGSIPNYKRDKSNFNEGGRRLQEVSFSNSKDQYGRNNFRSSYSLNQGDSSVSTSMSMHNGPNLPQNPFMNKTNNDFWKTQQLKLDREYEQLMKMFQQLSQSSILSQNPIAPAPIRPIQSITPQIPRLTFPRISQQQPRISIPHENFY